MERIWKELKFYKNGKYYDFTNIYEISNCGEIKSLNYKKMNIEKILKPAHDKDGYEIVCLRKNGEKTNAKVHRLVAETFIPNPSNLPQINHKDENKSNNNVNNLEWCSPRYNVVYSQGKKINQYDLKNRFIKTWKSLGDISRYYGVTTQAIYNCCTGKRKTSCGFKWEYYKEEYKCK